MTFFEYDDNVTCQYFYVYVSDGSLCMKEVTFSLLRHTLRAAMAVPVCQNENAI